MKIIYDDIVYSLQKAGGISELWQQLAYGNPKNSEHLIYANAVENKIFRKVDGAHYITKDSGNINYTRYINPSFNINEPFIFHSSYFRRARDKHAINIVHVYDFIYERYRSDLKSIIHKVQKKRAVMKSDAVICISESTKADLLHFYPKYKGNIKVIHCGYDTEAYRFFNDQKREKVIVYVGSRKRYKHFSLVIDLLKQLPDFKLMIIGSGNLTEDEIKLLKPIGDRYQKVGFLEKDELAKAYNKAYLLCYSSDYEGFGIPPIEAQACGCPVVCQMTSSLVEVVQDTGVVLYPDAIEKTAAQILDLENGDNYKILQDKGLENVKRFSWDKCRNEVNQFYSELSQM